MKDFYKILDVPRSAIQGEIKKAYKKMALLNHPDKGGDEDLFKLIVDAYNVLSDPQAREQYDVSYDIFQETNLEEAVVSVACGFLMPGKTVPYSAQYRAEHETLISKYSRSPLSARSSDPKNSCLNIRLYSLSQGDERHHYDDIYAYIKALEKSNITSKATLPELTFLNISSMLKIISAFLIGDYWGDILRKLISHLAQVLDIQRGDPNILFYEGVYDILSMVNKSANLHAHLIFSILKIDNCLKQKDAASLQHIMPLFYNRYYRNLYVYVLNQFWEHQALESLLYKPSFDYFDGREQVKAYVSNLQNKMGAGSDDPTLMSIFQYMKTLFSFDKDMRRVYLSTSMATNHRTKAFDLLDWLPFLMQGSTKKILANVFLQIGILFCEAASAENSKSIAMADETLALKLFINAVGLAKHATPDIEIYINVHVVRYLSAFKFESENSKEIRMALKQKTLNIINMFPFFDMLQSNMDIFEEKHSSLHLMRCLLHAMVSIYENSKQNPKAIPIDHSNASILYQAYEACLKNWYGQAHDIDLENQFRTALMDEMLFDKGWTLFDVEQNIDSDWVMVSRDQAGWLKLSRSLPYNDNPDFIPYRSINGAEINHNTGHIEFFMTPWSNDRPVSEKLLTLFDLYQALSKKLTHGIFSLDPPDPDIPYHPFNLMRFAPNALYGSELFNSMLLTDYMLKFMTTGQEVQGQHPFDHRSVSTMIDHLPTYLKKVITDFHNASRTGMLHRFWIEAEEIDVMLDELPKDNCTRIGVNRLKMVVKKHRMERDIHGELKDVDNEDEGWPIYVLSPSQFADLTQEKSIIAGHAMIFIYPERRLFYWENNEVVREHVVKDYDDTLKRLYLQPRESNGKVTFSRKNGALIYRMTREMSAQTGLEHRYSAEFIFAHEFTTKYDEFAQYLPEFGRLKELCKVISVVRFLANIHDNNEQHLTALTVLLSQYHYASSSSTSLQDVDNKIYDEYKAKMEKSCHHTEATFDKLREQLATSILKQKWSNQLNQILLEVGTLDFSEYSSEVSDIFDNFYNQLQRDNPHVSYYELKTIADGKRSEIAAQLSSTKRQSVRAQLTESFSNLLSAASYSDSQYYIDELMNYNIKPLQAFLIQHEQNKVVNELLPQFSNSSNHDIAAAIDDYGQEAATRIAKEQACQQLRVLRDNKEKLSAGFNAVHLGTERPIPIPKEQCFWVPASVRHEVKKEDSAANSPHSFFVYGGVNLQPRANIRSGGGPPGGRPVNRGTFNRAQITKGYQSHHIVSPTNRATKNHPLLKAAGIGINSAVNRIYLPPKADMHPTRSIHLGRHTASYSQKVADRMGTIYEQGKTQGWNQSQYRDATRKMLSGLRKDLRNGNIGLNKHHRPWATKW